MTSNLAPAPFASAMPQMWPFGGGSSVMRLIGRGAPWGLFLLALATLVTLSVRTPGGAGLPAARALAAPSNPTLPAALALANSTETLPVGADAARLINAAVPFVLDGVVAAAPYRFAGSEADRTAATACLTTAVLYEAGDDAVGQAAVAQVVLNRLRHPAFPKTVCGVIFQGAERATGCQFTFACDGALARSWPGAAWKRAQIMASAALAGMVDPTVGTATHYHTDWVVPAWSAQLDKVAKVGTHLFFRWRGSWGAATAFVGIRSGAEVIDPRLAARFGIADPSPTILTVAADVLQAESASAVAVPKDVKSARGDVTGALDGVNLRGARLHLADTGNGVFVLALTPAQFAGDYAMTSLDLCRGRSRCTVFGFLRGNQLPNTLPLAPDAPRQASFYYDGGLKRGYWNCAEISRLEKADCIPGTAAVTSADGGRDRRIG